MEIVLIALFHLMFIIILLGMHSFECKYDDVPNDTGEVVTWNHENTDLYCCTGGGPGNKGLLTTDWVETITPSGEAHTTCKFLGGGTPCNEIYPDLNVCCRSG